MDIKKYPELRLASSKFASSKFASLKFASSLGGLGTQKNVLNSLYMLHIFEIVCLRFRLRRMRSGAQCYDRRPVYRLFIRAQLENEKNIRFPLPYVLR